MGGRLPGKDSKERQDEAAKSTARGGEPLNAHEHFVSVCLFFGSTVFLSFRGVFS